ncbi:TolB-like translocation protein [Mesoterricola silvestris]|uniref:Uncharacterized protein n=1 Tax=Mesoterricola silvestris TaxID=2927979 RepID=A0AA48GR84_9BACT|nr:hypothetical protein [Mesoterricola silvestris]BDU72750.1 hypothetical protein METEAL_19240 [Mesoterricola silvestris]
MKALVIAKREMAEQKLAWAAAGYVALAGLVVPWIRPMGDIRGILGPGLDLGFGVALSAVLGASMVPGDLQSGRMGFYFARPVAAGTVLLGRFLGAWLLAVGGGLVAALPQVLLAPRNTVALAVVTAVSAVVSVFVLLGAHVLGTMFRSRSAWILLDLAVLGAFGASMHLMIGRIAEGGAFLALPWFLGGAGLLVLAVLGGAAHLQVTLGGADLRAGHRVLSLCMAAGLGATALAGAGFTAWVRGGGPASLSTFRVVDAAPSGDWIALVGEGRFHRQAFLLDTATGAAVEAGTWGRFSPDGRRYVEFDLGASRVRSIDLGQAPARVLPPWSIALPGRRGVGELRALSRDGRIAVILCGDCLTVADVEARRVLHQSTGNKDLFAMRFVFPSETLLRAYGGDRDGSVAIRELDLATGAWTEPGRMPPGPRFPDASGRWVLVGSQGRYEVCEGRTGEILRRVPGEPMSPPRFLEDGGLAWLEEGPGGHRLRVLDPSGAEAWSRTLEGTAGMNAWLLPEPGSGRILVGLLEAEGAPGANRGRRGRILAADPSRGTVETVSAEATLPLGFRSRMPMGALAARLRVGNGGGLAVAGPDGSLRKVIPGARWASE